MHLSSLIEMVESGFDDRVLLVDGDERVTGAMLGTLARRAASAIADGHGAVVYAGENHPMLPVAFFGTACAGVPFVPINYRLDDRTLGELIGRQPDPLVLADSTTAARLGDHTVQVFDDWLADLPHEVAAADLPSDDEAVAVALYTSGTTAAPKSALLRHRHLMAYLLNTVEFGSADIDDAALIAVPPYHIAGVANLLTNTFAGRRLVYLRSFDAACWLETVRSQRITSAMVVPTMLSRIVDELDGAAADVPTLRTLAYGGASISDRIVRAALTAFPDTGFVNAYGLTETASTIAVLGPDDHRAALASDDPAVTRRLTSTGRVLPSIDLQVRDDADQPLGIGEVGTIHVRGEQIAGEYASGSMLDADGWFCTRDHGYVDDAGYLYIAGRSDDTIIRGGENIAPAEIEAALLAHSAVAEACVVGVPDDVWGQRIVAAVVLRDRSRVSADELRATVRSSLRSSKTPEEIVFRRSLPHTETGKLLRREVARDVTTTTT